MKKFMMLAACAASFYACSSNDVNTPDIDEATTGLLSVSTSVLTQNTKGTKTVGSGNTKADGKDTGPVMTDGLQNGSKIGVFVFNSGVFTPYSGGTNSAEAALNQEWELKAGENEDTTIKWRSNPFTLGIQPATVYAYFPYSSTLSFTDKTEPTFTVTPGYTDYLYGAHGTNNNGVITASTVNSTNNKAAIQLNHALAMISFTFTRGTGYPTTEACQVNAITINNLPAGGAMSVVNNGAITPATDPATTTLKVSRFHDAAYAPEIGGAFAEWTITEKDDKTGYIGNVECNFNTAINTTLPNGILGSATTNGTSAVAPLFHALVLPNTGMPGFEADNKVDVSKLHAVIKIDGVTYTIPLKILKDSNGNDSDLNNKWEANKHYTYNLTIKGTSGQGNVLEVSSVTVNQWTAGGSSDIEI